MSDPIWWADLGSQNTLSLVADILLCLRQELSCKLIISFEFFWFNLHYMTLLSINHFPSLHASESSEPLVSRQNGCIRFRVLLESSVRSTREVNAHSFSSFLSVYSLERMSIAPLMNVFCLETLYFLPIRNISCLVIFKSKADFKWYLKTSNASSQSSQHLRSGHRQAVVVCFVYWLSLVIRRYNTCLSEKSYLISQRSLYEMQVTVCLKDCWVGSM